MNFESLNLHRGLRHAPSRRDTFSALSTHERAGGVVDEKHSPPLRGRHVIKDFGRFLVKLFFGRYDEMAWEDCFHGFILVCLVCGAMYIALE